MFIFRKITDLQAFLSKALDEGKSLGFVPTMGALHAGHLSLIAAAQDRNQLVICSIFVNPTQFNNAADLEHYPRSEADDIRLLEQAGCDILFLPDVQEVYPEGMQASTTYPLGDLESHFEGAHRPGHFQGVAQVVDRLLDIIKPHTIYLGQKDYQQVAVLTRMLQLQGSSTSVIVVPTMREPDGLAMSSRNRRLTEPQRAVAGVIYQCLVSVQAKQGVQHFSVVQKECKDILTHKGFRLDYISLADASTLEPLDDYEPGRPMVVLLAAQLGDIRLIDNLLL
jgi:pantoate--beta-alanine ligase